MGEIINFPGYNDNFIKLTEEIIPNAYTYAYVDKVDYELGTYKADELFYINDVRSIIFIGGFPCEKIITKRKTYKNFSVVVVCIDSVEYMKFIHVMKELKKLLKQIEPEYDKICKKYLDLDLFKSIPMDKIIDALK